MFDSAWGKRVSGFAAPAVMAILFCITLTVVSLCAALPKTQFAHADTPQSYQLWWDDLNVDGGSISVVDQDGDALSPGSSIKEGTRVTIAFTPDEGNVLCLAFVHSGDLFSEEARIESTLSGNTLTFVMPGQSANVFYDFVSETNSIGYNLASHGSTKITNQNGAVVTEGKYGEMLTATYTPASGYSLKSAQLVCHQPLFGEVKSELAIVDGKSVFEMPAGDARVEAQFVRIDGKYEVFTYAYALGGSVIPQDKNGRESYFFAPGETVYLKCVPNDGFEIDQVYVMPDGLNDIEAKLQNDGRYAFEMPTADVHVNASFTPLLDGVKVWLNEYVVGPQGLSGFFAQGDLFGDVWIADATGRAVAGVKAGELAEVCVTPDEDHFVHAVRYSYSLPDGPGGGEQIIVPDSNGRYTFVMPDCDDVSVIVYYERVDDGKFDVAYWSQEVKPENMSAKITDKHGNEVSAAAPGEKVFFEYLPGTDFVLNYVLNYMVDEDGSCEKISPTKYSLIVPNGPLTIDVGLSRVGVDIQTDSTVYIPESGQDSARGVAMGVFWDLVAGKTPNGMTDDEARALRDMLNDPSSSGAYLDVILRANETDITESQEGLILDIIRNDEFIVFSFDLSVIFGMSTDDGWGSEVNLTELSDGVHFQLMPENAENKFIRIVRIHEGIAEEVPIANVNDEGVIIEADRFSVYSAVASDATTVAFESNGGSAVASQEIGYGQKLAKPADPTREGYVFEGWYADEALTIVYDFEAPVVQHLGTLYAKWSTDGSGAAPGDGGGNAGSGQASGDSIAKTGDASGLTVALLSFGALVAAGAVAVARRRLG